MAIGVILSAMLASANQDLHPISPHALSEVEPSVVPRRASVVIQSSALLRREEKEVAKPGSLLATEETSESNRELYVKVGNSLCDGGGLWRRYELNTVVPGSYAFCAQACDAKGECVGFDAGNTGCNLYTQKAVAVGTWPNVRFNGVAAFTGEGDHDAYPQRPEDLMAGETQFGTDQDFKCYRKTYWKPANSYYWKIGDGTCSGGGLWKRYKVDNGDYETCEDTCNQRDECIGFDVGTWAGATDAASCFLYTQKAVVGAWPGVYGAPLDGAGDHNKWATKPSDLSAGTIASYDANSNAKCYGKTHWVSLDQYYMSLGDQLCTGGGLWKHYKITGGKTLKHCKHKCDGKAECIGLDFTDTECRLYTSKEVAADTWEGVEFDSSGAFAGADDHDRFAPHANSLSIGAEDAPAAGSKCLMRTHPEPDQ